MQSIPYCLRAATKRSMYLAPPPKVASGPSCREIWPTLVKYQKVEISLNKTCICPCFGGFLMLNSLPWVRPPRPGWALTPEWLLPWSGSWSGSRHSGWSTWWTWGSQGRWRQRQCHRRTAGWGRARCPGRRRRPGPRTARCCRSPALWSLARSTHKQSLFCGGLWESPMEWSRLELLQLLRSSDCYYCYCKRYFFLQNLSNALNSQNSLKVTTDMQLTISEQAGFKLAEKSTM